MEVVDQTIVSKAKVIELLIAPMSEAMVEAMMNQSPFDNDKGYYVVRASDTELKEMGLVSIDKHRQEVATLETNRRVGEE